MISHDDFEDCLKVGLGIRLDNMPTEYQQGSSDSGAREYNTSIQQSSPVVYVHDGSKCDFATSAH
jgi:hypothetical protein